MCEYVSITLVKRDLSYMGWSLAWPLYGVCTVKAARTDTEYCHRKNYISSE